jgi:PIN domain nuclease of toxin-antitoxin system
VKVLLDTHALLWWLSDDDRLGRRARDLIEDPGNDVLVSMVSLWEIAVNTRIGKLQADIGEITDAVRRDGFTLLDIGIPHLLTLAGRTAHLPLPVIPGLDPGIGRGTVPFAWPGRRCAALRVGPHPGQQG